MLKKITFLGKIFIFVLIICTETYSINLKIVPLEKPVLSKEIKEEKLSKNIIKPKEKPVSKPNQEIVLG